MHPSGYETPSASLTVDNAVQSSLLMERDGVRRRWGLAMLVAAAIGMIATSSLAVAASHSSLYAQDGWMLSVERDAFTGLVRCSLNSRDGRMVYQSGALGLRFGRRRSLMDAWYRVDNGPPHRWQDDYPSLIGSGVEIDGPGLTDPTRGIVWIPIDTVAGASNVEVRLAGSGNGRLFRLRGFAAMLAAATRLDCRFS